MFVKVCLVACARWLTVGAASAGLYWAAVVSLAPENTQVNVYVWEVPSVVVVDGVPHPVNSTLDQPINLELKGGWRDLELWVGGVAARRDRFYVPPNSEVAQSVWIRNARSVTLPPPPDDEALAMELE